MPRIPILMYHEVAPREQLEELARKTQRGYLLAAEEFERHIAALAAAGFESVSLDALVRPPAAARPVVITFDDGYAGNFRHAFPILQRHGYTATFFVVTNKIGLPHMLAWDELREMAGHGMSIESHTANHRLLSRLDEAALREELAGSKQAIEQHLGRPVRYVSLPSGDSNPAYPALAQACGYLGGCGSRPGWNDPHTDRWHWRRLAVKADLPAAQLVRLLSGDRRLWAAIYLKQFAKRAAAQAIGKAAYERLYRWLYAVEEQDQTRHTSG